MYGEDALDVTKLKYLTKFDFSARNYRALLSKYRPDIALQVVDQDRGACGVVMLPSPPFPTSHPVPLRKLA